MGSEKSDEVKGKEQVGPGKEGGDGGREMRWRDSDSDEEGKRE